MNNTNVFIDFDSTFVQVETLEEIILVSYSPDAPKSGILQEIQNKITDLAMIWDICFWKALEARISLLDINKENIEHTVDSLKKKITPSFLKNKEFIKQNKENIYILSWGFRECIIPITNEFWIDESHVFANEFLYDINGNIKWIDTRNPLSQDWGKVKIVNDLNLPGKKISILDGWNDYKLKEGKAVDTFFAFIENVERDKVVQAADETLETFDDFIKWTEKK